jgi:phytoene dehydrogenase-like protein
VTDVVRQDAVVIGSGPNGLAAAITLVRSGNSVLLLEAKSTTGGGMRSAPLTLPGFTHDVCSAVHPMGLASPFFRTLDLPSLGVEWVHSPAPLAHPLDNGEAVTLERSLEDTVGSLGDDGSNYLRLMGPLVRHWEELVDDVLAPLHFPGHPLMFAMFGLRAIESTRHMVRGFRGSAARSLFAGLASHSMMRSGVPGGASYGMVLAAAGHAVGWPIVRGGTQNLAKALSRCFSASGGVVRTDYDVHSLDELPEAGVVLLDITPRQLASIASGRVSPGYRRQLMNYTYGPGVFKVDWALSDRIPWQAEGCSRAATIHLGGGFEEIISAEDSVWNGIHPEKPFVILGQPSLFDRTLVSGGLHSAWAYCHVPNGSTFDMCGRIESQVERFAPGFKARIIARHTANARDLEAYNSNCVGGDIGGGYQSPFNRLLRPGGRLQPYVTPLRGVYLCSSSMPPGAGVHGMCGYHAAIRAMKDHL